MSWLSDFFKKKIEIPDIFCVSCMKPIKFPEHLENSQRVSWESTLMCEDCQRLHWERRNEERLRQEQEYYARIARDVAKKLRLEAL